MTTLYDGNGDGDREVIAGTIYESQALWDNKGDEPAHIVAQHLDRIFTDLYTSHPYQIHVMDERSDCPQMNHQDVECDEYSYAAKDEWDDKIGGKSLVLDDFNLLLTNLTYGGSSNDNVVGCGTVGGNTCVSEGGPDIAGTSLGRYHYEGTGAEAIQTAVHEVGHNLDMQHGVGNRDFDDIMSGSDTEYVISPLAPGVNTDGVCGNNSPGNDGSETVLDMYFYYCALENDYF